MPQKPIDRAVAKQELQRINALLEEPHLLIGGLAVQQYDVSRVSQDIDLICDFRTGQTLIRALYPSRDWRVTDKNNDEYRPSFHIEHRFENRGEITFGPKISEREPYDNIDWGRLLEDAQPFHYLDGTLKNVLIPRPHALAYTKFVSFLGRRAPIEKVRADLEDFVNISNHDEFSIAVFFDLIRGATGWERLLDEFRVKSCRHPDIQETSCLFGLASTFISDSALRQLKAPPVEPEKKSPHLHFAVATAEEFVEALGSNRTIDITTPLVDLGSVEDRFLAHVRWQQDHDGLTLTVRGVEDLEIRGLDNSRLIVSPRYTFVLAFENCRDVQLKDLSLGHEPPGSCTGGVIRVENTVGFRITNCQLFGCGTEGLLLKGVRDFEMIGSDIFECTYGIMTIESCAKVDFVRSTFRDNREFHGVGVRDSEDIRFDKCSFLRNLCNEDLFEVVSSSSITVGNSTIDDNQCFGVGRVEVTTSSVQQVFRTDLQNRSRFHIWS